MTMRLVTVCTLTLLVAVTLAAGCKKREPAAGANSTPPTSATSEAGPPTRGPDPVAASPATVVIPENGDSSAILRQLSLELRKYVLRTKSAPKTFEEFIANSHVQAPPAPVGKQYAIQSGAVVLAKR